MSQNHTTGAFLAGAALDRYALCSVSGGALVETTGPTVLPIGNVEDSYANGDHTSCRTFGRTYLIAGGTVTAGSLLMASTNGTVEDHDGTVGNYIVGLALEAGTAGDYVDSLLWTQGTKET
tara:strand:- start:3760 stop:4122 length:363 start_codon:yes stop_codon:yes gene_type:complete